MVELKKEDKMNSTNSIPEGYHERYGWTRKTINKKFISFSIKNKIKNLKINKDTIDQFRINYLDNGCGIGLIDLSDVTTDAAKQESLFLGINSYLGSLLEQNIKKEKIVEIKNIGKSMSSGGRYHQTSEGGSLHTDCPQWKHRPNYVGLFCKRTAKFGGDGKYLSAYAVHEEMSKNHPSSLKILYGLFHFDQRDDAEDLKNPTIVEPIFYFKDDKLSFRYLSNYIRDGHLKVRSPLTKEQNTALNNLDNVISNSDLIMNHKFSPGQALYIDNYRIIHGRDSFVDFDDQNKKRLLLRAWIKKN